MALLAATPDAVYRVAGGDADRVLDAGARALETTSDRVYAATADGLRVSTDGGDTWAREDTPRRDLHSVVVGETAFAGGRPLSVFRRTGDEWSALAGVRALADREDWPTPSFRGEAWARSLAVDGDRLLVGVEVGGLAVRDPDGDWRSVGPTDPDPDATQRCDDVHDVAVRSRGEWVLATGDGVYRTTDAGDTWSRLDTGGRRYCREVGAADGRVYVAVNASPPRWRPPDAALYAGDPDAGLQRVPYPGEPERFVVSWARDGDGLWAGANDGAVLRIGDGGVEAVAAVPVGDDAATAYGVRALAVA